VNAGRNTHPAVLPPTATDADELADEAAQAEHAFMQYVLLAGIPLADLEDDA
jgi:hypothetical protein